MEISIRHIGKKDLETVLKISDSVIGKEFLTEKEVRQDIKKSKKKGIKNSLVALDGGKIIAYIFMYAPGNLSANEYHSPDLWPSPLEKNAYLGSVTVLEEYQRKGIGRKLAEEALKNAKKQGAKTIIAHSWAESPGNSSLNFMKRLGGKTIKTYKLRWYEDSIKNGWFCSRCGNPCYCSSIELYIPIK